MTAGLARRVVGAACVTGAYRLPSGQTLDSFFDEYALAADPSLLHDVADAIGALLPPGTEVVAGLELGGVPLVVALSAVTGLPATFLRRAPKRYGTCRQIEGHPVDGRRVALVDDVVRSGTQLLAMGRVLRAAGATVTTATCVLERPLSGRTRLADAGIALAAVFTEADLLPALAGKGGRAGS